jgi:quercetin dioxygenase-like cupin family protein
VRVCFEKVSPTVVDSLRSKAKGGRIVRDGFVSLRALDRIDPKARDSIPHSARHRHCGDELIIVLKGCVTVELEDSGTRTRLEQWDYMHFSAEIPHAAYNTSTTEEAEVFVIRFFQLNRVGSRRSREDGLREILEKLAPPSEMPDFGRSRPEMFAEAARFLEGAARCFSDVGNIYTKIESWLWRLLENPKIRAEDHPCQILDFVGLGRLLQLSLFLQASERKKPADETQLLLRKYLGSSREEIKSDDLSKFLSMIRKEAHRISIQRYASEKALNEINVGKYLRGEVQTSHFASKDHLEVFARYFDVPRVLFDTCLLPTVPRMVVVRWELDHIYPPKYKNPGDCGSGAVYKLPCRVLADSDIAITFLRLPKGTNCAKNRHMGFELVLCLKGAVQIEIGDGKKVDCSQGEYLQYRSRFAHQLHNSGHEEAILFVIRFNELDT